MKLPVARGVISSSKIPYGIKQLCINTLIASAEHLVKIKPISSERIRVGILIDLPSLWNSEIIVFFGDCYFKGFFSRDEWIPLAKERIFENEWGLNIPEYMKVSGFENAINKEGGYTCEDEIWFIGELG